MTVTQGAALMALAVLVAAGVWDTVVYQRTMRDVRRAVAAQPEPSTSGVVLDLDTVEPSPQGVTS